MSLPLHKGYIPGCIGRVAELHARYYHQLAGFGMHFEAKVARELAEFCERYDDHRDGLWLALENDVIEGSIAIDGSHAGQDGAHLRWFITSAQVRGKGTGNTLLSAATAFCRSQRYERVYLWTFDGLGAARHLYEKFGFRLVHEQRGAQWGSEVDEQRFELRA
ncbi:MAG: GNAT family N-acetyltransferase [Burkholderiales bacterium]